MTQSFKEFFQLFLERKSFTNNLQLFEKMIKQLKSQISEMMQFEEGIEFYVDFDEDHTIRIQFFTIPPKNIPKAHRTDDAIYNPSDQTIYLFLKNIFHDIKKINPTTIIKSFPPILRDVIFHELTHAHEHIMQEFEDIDTQPSVAHYTGPENEQIRSKGPRYINNLAEMNAYFHQWLSRELQDNIYVRNAIKNNNITVATQLIVQRVKKEPHFKNLFEPNKKWFYKTIYTTLDQLMQ